jgi:hypothetical protein
LGTAFWQFQTKAGQPFASRFLCPRWVSAQGQFSSSFINFAKVFANFAKTFVNFAKMFTNFAETFVNFAKALANFSKVLTNFAKAVASFSKTFVNFAKVFANFAKAFAKRAVGPPTGILVQSPLSRCITGKTIALRSSRGCPWPCAVF